MQTQSEHITPLPARRIGLSDMLSGIAKMTKGLQEHMEQLESENRELVTQLRALQQEQSNIVAQDRQNEWIALLIIAYEMGMIAEGCSKKDFMQRMATALGSPGIADFNRQLYKFKLTASKYDDFFKKIMEVSQKEKTKDN